MKNTTFIWALFLITSLNGQNLITGTVSDAETNPLEEATVYLLGSSAGATTDKNGRFSIKAPDGKHAIKVSYDSGWSSPELVVNTENELNIILVPFIPIVEEPAPAPSPITSPTSSLIFKGKVLNEKKSPLPEVLVSVPGSSTSVNTDQNGNFEIEIPKGNHKVHFFYHKKWSQKDIIVTKPNTYAELFLLPLKQIKKWKNQLKKKKNN